MSVYLDDGDAVLHHGDALATLRTMPSASVHCIVTSPPFWALRDYGVDGQIGLEESPSAWCAALVAVFREARRVLRPDGVAWIEVGDTYNGSSATQGGDGTSTGIRRDGRSDASRVKSALAEQARMTAGDAGTKRAPGIKPKDLVGAPWLLAFALRADGWYLRSDTIWHRPNPMPESVTDRPTKAHSYVFLLSREPRYFFDADAIREPSDDPTAGRSSKRRTVRPGVDTNGGGQGAGEMTFPAGSANARSVWTIPTEPTPFAHFATFPQALAARCILAGTSGHGCCAECGAPWTRSTESTIEHTQKVHDGTRYAEYGSIGLPGRKHVTTLGWAASCACNVLECPHCDSTTHLPSVRDGVHPSGEPDAVLLASLRESPHGGEQGEHARVCDRPQGLPTAPPAGPPDGEPRGLPDGAPSGDGGNAWADVDGGRGRASHQRQEGGQPDREPGADGQAPARPDVEAGGATDRVPALRRDDPAAAQCPVCNSRLVSRPAGVVPCTVLDPFAGSATTLLVARRHGRRSVGIELSAEYLAIAATRLQQLSLLGGDAA